MGKDVPESAERTTAYQFPIGMVHKALKEAEKVREESDINSLLGWFT